MPPWYIERHPEDHNLKTEHKRRDYASEAPDFSGGNSPDSLVSIIHKFPDGEKGVDREAISNH